ncbi:MAG: hypothetical protein GY809_19455 [Planctomycetes bacterium]|nr:hypothetical protein [Planctomycetota bacterium]
MTHMFSKTETAVFAVSVILLMAGGLTAQMADTPQQNSSDLTEAYKEAIAALLPLMSAEDVGARYAPQIALQTMAAHASRPGAEQERETLARVLGTFAKSTEMTATVRHWFVLQIERIGKGESVPVLVELLSDPDKHMRDYARRALEKNPDPSATGALVKALKASKNDPAWTVGLINALGAKGSCQSVSEIARYLKDEDEAISEAAVTALTHLGGPASVKALTEAMNSPVAAGQMKVAQGLVGLAQAMQARNNYADAADIYKALNAAASKMSAGSVTAYARVAALNGLVVCTPWQGNRLAAKLIRDEDPKVQAGVVMAARLAPKKAIVRMLTRRLGTLDPVTQVQVLGLIADRGDYSSVSAVTPLLDDGSSSVQVAAVKALAEIGCVASAEALMGATLSKAASVQKAARLGLAEMTGPNVGDAIVAKATAGDAKLRAEMIQVMGLRHMTTAVDQLLAFAAESDSGVARAACKALGSVASEDDLNALAALVAKAKDRGVRNEAASALEAVLTKANQDSGAQIVIDQMGKATQDSKLALLKTLNTVGGGRALEFVVTTSASSNAALKDAAIRTLSDWPDYQATDTLVRIASKDSTSLIHHVVASRGAVRLIKNLDTASVDARVALCLKVLEQCRRVEEKREAIAALGVLPAKASVDRLLVLAKDDSVANEAGLAAVEFARRLRSQDRNASKALAQTIRDLDISKAVNDSADRVISGRR